MVKSKKVDPSKEYHFRLVSRSLADPLHDVPGESQNVLQPFVPQNTRKKNRGPTEAPGTALGLSEDVFGVHDNLDEDERELINAKVYGGDDDAKSVAASVSRLDGDCYFPPDGYDYSKHLRMMGGAGARFLEAGPGQQSVAAPAANREEQEALDALEDADEYEEADDDFFGDLVKEDVDEDTARAAAWGGHLADSDDDDEFEDEELPTGAKTKLDEDFDALLEEYADDQLGALDQEAEDEKLLGSKDLAEFEYVIDEHLNKPLRSAAKIRRDLNEHLADEGPREPLEWNDTEEPLEIVEVKQEPEWDCESVLSLRSNLSNHPGKVGRPERINGKALERGPARPAPLPEIDEAAAVELPEVSTYRPRGETSEERKARKDAVKEHKKLCRTLKKETKEAFKTEAKKNSVARNAGDLREGVRHRPL
jgi:protein LTV1